MVSGLTEAARGAGTAGAGPLVVKTVNVLRFIADHTTVTEEAKHDDFNTLIDHTVPMVLGLPSSNSAILDHQASKTLGLLVWSRGGLVSHGRDHWSWLELLFSFLLSL